MGMASERVARPQGVGAEVGIEGGGVGGGGGDWGSKCVLGGAD